jgi:serine/threonine-protein kinase
VGYGGWGEVYRAFDPTLQMEVALKLLKFEEPWTSVAPDRFLSEARRLARVHHPNVVVVHGADRHDGRYGIWTEFIRGRTLEAYAKEHAWLGSREASLIGIDLCQALSAVHAADLVHRDVKAGNVMREDGGRIVLMDFGSGAELSRDKNLTASRHIHGTPLAMAPEQIRGEIAGAATDVYGLGALLYWLVSGKYPIDASDFVEVVRKHERREYVPLRDRRADLPFEFVQVVQRAIAPDFSERFPSAGAMEQALAATLTNRRGSREWLHSGWGRAAIAAAGALACLALVLLVHRGSKKEEDIHNTQGGLSDQTIKGQDGGHLPARGALTATAFLRRLASKGEEPVAPGSRVAPGDKLSMILEGSDSMYVYVLDEDLKGNIFVLYPIPGVRPANPLPPGVQHRLPGQIGDSLAYWNVTSAGERESIITVASRGPLEQWEREIQRFPRAVRGKPVAPHRFSDETIRTLRGLGGITVEPPGAGQKSRRSLADAIRALEERRFETGDIWIWTAELENP